MSRNPRTSAGRQLLLEVHGDGDGIFGKFAKNQDRIRICAIEDEAAATERRLTVERLRTELPDDWHPWEPTQHDEAIGYNDALNRVRSILDDLATADVDEEAGNG